MKQVVFFSISLLFCLQLQAQWSVFHSGKYHDLNLSTANKQVAIYRGLACEVQLDSKKNKELKLTSSNATIKQNSAGSYTITTNEGAAIVQIYSVKKSKMKLLAEVSIPSVDVAVMTDLNLYGNEIQVGYNMADFVNENYTMTLYDSLVYNQPREIYSWSVDFGTNLNSSQSLKTFNGSGSFLSEEVMNYLKLAPEGTEYKITAGYTGFNSDPYGNQPWPSRIFTIGEQQLPAAKYLILNNTPQNKAWFDDKDQSSLIGMLNNNYSIQPDLSKGILNELKTSSKDGDFSGLVIDGMDSQSLKDLKYNENLKYVEEVEPTKNEKIIISNDGMAVPVYVKKGADPSVKTYLNWDPMIEHIDPSTETLDPSEAEIIPGTENDPIPFNIEYRVKSVNFAYTTDSIQQIIIRYDSVLNIVSGAIEIQPTRISLARKFGKNDLADVVFSMKVKDLVKFQSYAPTIHLKNDKANATFFDLENPKSLLGYLNTKKVRESGIASFPMLNRGGAAEFGDDCDPSGKSDGKLIEVETSIEPYLNLKLIITNGEAREVYVKKGINPSIKEYELGDPMIDQLDPLTETTDPSEAEILTGGEMLPYPVEFRIQYVNKSQYKGLTDLFIKRKYLFDPTYGVYVAKPTTIGFAQQMPGQTKPTLIMQVDLTSDPKLLSMLPKMQSQLFLGQLWAMSLLQNEVEAMGETIDATNIPALQKKFQFRKKMVSIMGDMELSNEPHF
jgi:hypothetical protein